MGIVNYDWDEIEDNIDEEYDDVGITHVDYTTEPSRHGYTISQYRDSQTSFYISNCGGSITELTDEIGAVTGSQRYTAFGETIEVSGNTTYSFTFRGQLGYFRDQDLSNIYFKDRNYQLHLGRWLSGKAGKPFRLVFAFNLGFSSERTFGTTYFDPPPLPLPCCDAPPIPDFDSHLDFSCRELTCSELPDRCQCCKEETANWDPNDLIYETPRRIRRFNRCRATLRCAPNCPGGHLGHTSAPVPGPNGTLVMDICISCNVRLNSIKSVIKHELIHFVRFCNAGHGIRNCAECLPQEEAAYEASCLEEFKFDPVGFRRCVNCGKFFGCPGCIRDEPIPCTPKDLGVDVWE